MKVFTADENIPLLKEVLQQKNKIYEFTTNNLTNEELIENGTEFLIVRSTIKVNENLLKNTKVKFVATATSGTDHIDTEYLAKNNINFISSAGSNANSVAEYVIFSILLWIQKRNRDLSQLTLGIVGFGHIGKKVKIYAETLGIKTLVNDPPLEKQNLSNQKFYELDEILDKCNIITIHTPMILDGINKTLNLFDANKIEKIAKNALLINTARGGIVDENALFARRNELDFVIDVWENEPDFNLELAREAFLSTPHIAGHSFEGKLKATKLIVEELNKTYQLGFDLSEVNQILSQGTTLTKEEMKNADLTLSALNESRKLSQDSDFLLSLSDEKTRVKEFKKFRNEYPKRNEILFLK